MLLDDPDNSGSFTGELARAIERPRASAIHVTESAVTILPGHRYLSSHTELEIWALEPKQRRMEHFYHDMRCKSGTYINRISNYCGSCRFDVKQGTRPGAYPFDALWWDFIALNETKLRSHIRMVMPYRNWVRMAKPDKIALLTSAKQFLETLD